MAAAAAAAAIRSKVTCGSSESGINVGLNGAREGGLVGCVQSRPVKERCTIVSARLHSISPLGDEGKGANTYCKAFLVDSSISLSLSRSLNLSLGCCNQGGKF